MEDDRRHLLAVAAVVAVVLVLAGGWFVGTHVFVLGGNLAEVVRADAAVSAEPSNATGEPGSATVTWTDNAPRPGEGPLAGSEDPEHAEYLVVAWTVDGVQREDPRPTDAVAVTGGTWRLAAVGHSVTLTERDAANATTVEVVVTAVRGDAKTVVAAEEVTL